MANRQLPIIKTCGECAYWHRTIDERDHVGACPETRTPRSRTMPGCPQFNAPSGLQWSLQEDGSWQLRIPSEGRGFCPGFVAPYRGTGKYLAMYSQPELRWFMQVHYGTIRDCARALVAAVKWGK